MRTIPMNEAEKANELKDDQKYVDWRADPIEMLEAMDAELQKHGLEIVQRETKGDYYIFSIEKLKKS
jgi:hypothetical protein